MGGMGLDTAPQALVRVYEAAKDHWQPLASMPTPRYGATAFARGTQIFLMGRNQILLCHGSVLGWVSSRSWCWGRMTRAARHVLSTTAEPIGAGCYGSLAETSIATSSEWTQIRK